MTPRIAQDASEVAEGTQGSRGHTDASQGTLGALAGHQGVSLGERVSLEAARGRSLCERNFSDLTTMNMKKRRTYKRLPLREFAKRLDRNRTHTWVSYQLNKSIWGGDLPTPSDDPEVIAQWQEHSDTMDCLFFRYDRQ